MDPAQIGRAAGRLAKRATPAVKQSGAVVGEVARQSEAFTKHVLPAAVKPLHALWHEVLGFIFLVFAILGAWRIFRRPGEIGPAPLALAIFFIVVVAGYGVSSIRKARRISRS